METKNPREALFTHEIPEKFVEKADVLHFKKAQMIYQEGSTPLGAYFVQDGSAKITKIGSFGREQIIKIATKGELLNFADLFSSSRFRSSAQTIEDSSFLFVPKQEFWNVVDQHHELFWQLMIKLSMEIELVEEKIVDLAYKPVRGRLADAILSLAPKMNCTTQEAFSVCLTRNDLAGYVGTVRETVNRLLSEMRTENIISTHGSCIKVRDWKGLEKISKMYN